MRRVLPGLLALLLVACPTVSAQHSDTEHFVSFDGLERIVARSWTAPFASGEEAAATPEPADDAVLLLSLFLYEFDSPANAATGWQRIDDGLQQTHLQDRHAPMGDDIPLQGLGDQAQGYLGELELLGQTLTFVFATIQEGSYVYSVMGQMVGLDGADETRTIVETLVAADPGDGEEMYDPDGASTGGLWNMLDAVDPDIAPGSTVTDLIVFPMPEASSDTASAREENLSANDVHNFSEIEGVRSIYGVTYLSDDTTGQPAPGGAGIFRIESWIVPFEDAGRASEAVDPIAERLTGTINVQSTSNQRVSVNDMVVTKSLRSGPVQNESLPGANGAATVQQVESTVYAVLVYSTDSAPADVAQDIAQHMIDTPVGDDPVTNYPDGSAEGGIWARFPQPGDQLLNGLQPGEFVYISIPQATASGTVRPARSGRSHVPERQSAVR